MLARQISGIEMSFLLLLITLLPAIASDRKSTLFLLRVFEENNQGSPD
jgi:hypothetical protein